MINSAKIVRGLIEDKETGREFQGTMIGGKKGDIRAEEE